MADFAKLFCRLCFAAFPVLASAENASVDAVRGDGLIPFLAITGRPTESEVRAKVAAIHAQKIESFLIYARSGLELEYMGEEWLKLNEWFCDEAERRGMKVWLYDEYNWPSGTCKGRVPGENDDWRYAEYGVFRNSDGSYRWTTALAPAGWVNVCEPAAVARFIELTHDVYAKRLARWFANKTILGIFTDEPGHPVRIDFPDGKPLVSFRKYSGMEEEYLAATGRTLKGDVEKCIETKDGAVWAVYCNLMGLRFRSAYFDQLRDWCDRHGILLTGHLMSENNVAASALYNGNPIRCLRGESLPGMDDVYTAYAADAPRQIEWVTYNVARQAVLHRGNGGLAELYACGPANHVPATLRTVMWMCAFHGIDRYISCMDVMDEKGLIEKHRYLAPAGPIHPWYEKYAHVLADEARIAAAWARKTVSEREVAVRYPNSLAAKTAFKEGIYHQPGFDLIGLLGTLERNQFTCRLVDECEATDLPLVFSCQNGRRFSEERTGKTDLTLDDVLACCRARLPATFSVFEQDGTFAAELLVRTFSDGSSAVVNMQGLSNRVLVAERRGDRTVFELPARGVCRFDAGALPKSDARPASSMSFVDVEWDLSLDSPNLRRVNFDGSKRGVLTLAAPIKDIRFVVCDLMHRQRVVEIDGEKVVAMEPCTSLRPGYNSLYRQTEPFDLAAGTHRLVIASGETDDNFFLPVLFVAGDFAVFNGVLAPRPKGKVQIGPLSASGLADFTGTATWSADVKTPSAAHARLRVSTGGRTTHVVLGGRDLGVRAWAPFEWEVPRDLAGREVKLEISVSTSVQPMLGDPAAGKWDVSFWHAVTGPDGPCGLISAEWRE